jgi:antitoxin VapB
MLKHMSKAPMEIRRVRIFKNGRNQAVRIPKDFELRTSEARMIKDGDRLIIDPAPASLLEILATLSPIEETFAPIADAPPEPTDL